MEPTQMTGIVSLINSVGFPIFVAIFMLFKGSKDNRELKDSVVTLTSAVEKQTTLIELVMKQKGE